MGSVEPGAQDQDTVVQLGVGKHGLLSLRDPDLNPSSVLWPWVRCIILLCPSFNICEMGLSQTVVGRIPGRPPRALPRKIHTLTISLSVKGPMNMMG